MTARRTAARTLGLVALVAPVASVGLLTAPAALAATGSAFTAPTPAAGSSLTGEQGDVTVTASVPACAKNAFGNCSSTPTTTLTVSSNGVTFSATPKKWGTSASSITATVPTSAANGTWNASLSDGGAATDRSFTLDFDTSAPLAFRTQTTSGDAQDVAFYWAKNPESDLTKYVLTENGTTLFSGSSSAAGCSSSSTCSTSFAYSSPQPGDHSYSLVAIRPGVSASHVSPAAGTSTTLTVPPKPTPSASPSSAPGSGPAAGGSTGGTTSSGSSGGGSTGSSSAGGSTSGGTSTGGSTGSTASGSGGGAGGPSGSGGSTGTAPSPTPAAISAIPTLSSPVVQQRRAFALTFNSFSPSLGIPKLPPLPSTDDGVVAAEPKLADGTYVGTLPYKPQTETTKTVTASSDSKTFVTNVLDSAQIAKSIAAALILMLAFGHLRRFLATATED